jgi:uncharacterized membrane protein
MKYSDLYLQVKGVFMPKAAKKTKKKTETQKGLEKIEEDIETLEQLVRTERKEEKLEFGEFEKELAGLRKLSNPIIEKFTFKDFSRGFIGGIIGMSSIAWHEVVIEGARAMHPAFVFIITLFTLFAGASVLYFSQYRKIKEQKIIFKLLPKRFVVFYFLSLLIVMTTYTFFGIVGPGHSFTESVKLILVVALPTMIGASAADIIR